MECGITDKPSTLVNTMSNTVLERIHQALGNLIRTFKISNHTYFDKNDPWTGILDASTFAIFSATNREKL